MEWIEKMGFTKARKLSNALYVLAAVFLLIRILVMGQDSAGSLPMMGLGVLFFCLGIIVYSKGCRCPKCGKLQPRYVRYRCVDCQTELDSFIGKQ